MLEAPALMQPPFELYVAVRYLLARRKQAFISIISLISTVGVAVGVAAVILALALMTGLQEELRARILGSAAHVYVWKLGEGLGEDYRAEVTRLRDAPHVLGAAPVILGKALISGPETEAFITVKGIDAALEPTVTDVGDSMVSGRLEALAEAGGNGREGIVIGQSLSSQLSVFVGDTVTVLTPNGTLSPLGIMPRSRRLEVVGVFSLGLFEYDSAYGYVTLDVARRLLDRTTVDYVELRVDDIYRAPEVSDELAAALGPQYLTQDWADLNRSLFSALWLERLAVSIAIGLIVMVAALNIVASLILLVMEKSRDIAILKTMGTSRRSIMSIFMLQGLVIGVVGTALGGLAGVGLASVLDRYRLIQVPADVYQISHVPFVVEPEALAVVLSVAVTICFLATIYPSRQAAGLDPAEALRYQ